MENKGFNIKMLQNKPRYDESNFLEVIDGFGDSLKNYFIELILREATYEYYTIPKNKIYRIDLISKSLYNNDFTLFWIILAVNSIVYMEELSEGLVLRYPTLSTVETIYFNHRDSLK